MIAVSACLCGVNCKYNGKNNFNEFAFKLFQAGKAILICPEELGGMSTPREPHEIEDGTGADVLDGKAKVVSNEGLDSTGNFIKGAKEAYKVAKNANVNLAILKVRSPSCGHGAIYDGSFKGIKIKGNGVAAELFIRNGIKVITEEELDEEIFKNLRILE